MDQKFNEQINNFTPAEYQEPMVELHSITCSCERCKTVSEKNRNEFERLNARR